MSRIELRDIATTPVAHTHAELKLMQEACLGMLSPIKYLDDKGFNTKHPASFLHYLQSKLGLLANEHISISFIISVDSEDAIALLRRRLTCDILEKDSRYYLLLVTGTIKQFKDCDDIHWFWKDIKLPIQTLTCPKQSS